MKLSLRLTVAGSVMILALTSAKIVLQDNGIAGYTNSPGEQNCTACHNSFSANTGGGSLSITTTPSIGATGYVPGATYTVNVTVAKTGVSLFGFGTEILNASNANAGTISVINTAQTKLLNSGARRNVVHQLNGGAATDTKTFSFLWVAPSTAGAATIYAAGVAANGNGQSSSDYVYTASLPISSSVGIKEQDAVSSLAVYPNPATERITVSYELREDAVVSCNLSNLQGQVVASFSSANQAAGPHEQVFNIPSSVCAGLYLLNLNIGGQTSSRRVIVR